MHDFVIREAQFSDAEGIASVHVSSWQETYKGIVPDSYLSSLSVVARQGMWESAIARNSSRHKTFVATVAGEIIGFVSGGEARETEHGKKGELAALYLLKAYHGRGIGRSLFEALTDFLKSIGIDDMYLWVLDDNPTKNIYEAWGGNPGKDIVDDIGGVQLKEVLIAWEQI